jgi:peptide chain release factor subunit 1
MESDRFRRLLDVRGPFASVYFDDSQDTDDAAAELDLKCRTLREQLERHGANESITSAIENAVFDLRLPVGRGRRAVIAASTGVILNEYLLEPVARPVIRVSELPYIVPILESGDRHSRYLLVVVDPTGAIITRHSEVARSTETVDARTGSVSEMPGEHIGHGVLSSSPVAERVSELVLETGFGTVFVVGDPDTRLGLLAALPQPIRDRALSLPIASRRGGYDFEEIQRAIDSTLSRQRRSAMDTAAARFTAEAVRHSGLAAEGLDAVCWALQRGIVKTLLIGDLDDAMVVADEGLTVVAPTGELLTERGAVPARTVRADEALPLLAISCGAALVRTDERIAPVDGIAAVLRSPAPQPARRRSGGGSGMLLHRRRATTLETGRGDTRGDLGTQQTGGRVE